MTMHYSNGIQSKNGNSDKKRVKFFPHTHSMPSSVIMNVYERRASMSAVEGSTSVPCSYSTTLNVFRNSRINTPEKMLERNIKSGQKADVNKLTEKRNVNIEKRASETRFNNHNNNNENGSFQYEDANHVRKLIKSHEESNPEIYKNIVHKVQRRLLVDWMNEKLGQSLEDVSELEDPFEEIEKDGKSF